MTSTLTPEEIAALNASMQAIVPGFRMFDRQEFMVALRAAGEALKNSPDVKDDSGKTVLVPRLSRKVVTDPRRKGYGVPFAWWWIWFEMEILQGIASDPWSEVKWWKYEELRGQGKTMVMWGCQNCLAPETPVRMFDGSVRMAGDVVVGDVLTGDDMGPRTVLSTCKGEGWMTEVKPATGEPFRCTDEHRLTVWPMLASPASRDVLVDMEAGLFHGLSNDSMAAMIRRSDRDSSMDEVVKFTAEPCGFGSYAGFEVDGNHRFLLADGTINHNSSKTSWMGRFTIVMMIAWTVDAVFYVTGPKKSHSEDKGWKNVTDWANYVQSTQSRFFRMLGASIRVTKTVVSVTGKAGSGEARFVSAEESSTIRGKKSATHDKSGLIGITCVIVDEFSENSNLDLKRINNNASSNYNYFQVMACNPDPDYVGHASIREFSWPRLRSNLDRTQDFCWETNFGCCIRFAWANNPNRILGRTQWGYLLDDIRMERARIKGNTAIDSEVDAWGFGSGANGAPLDEAQIRLAGTYAEPTWTGPTTRFCVFDCAFGGQDPATAFIAEAGPAIFEGSNGQPVEKEVVNAIEQVTLPVSQEFILTQEVLDEINSLMEYTGGRWPVSYDVTGVNVGDRLNGNFHMAYLAIKTMKEFSIPPGNATFDSSQRGDCDSIMKDFMGRDNVRWTYEGSRSIRDEDELTGGWYKWPFEYERQGDGLPPRPKKWSECCTGTISSIWFFACEMIRHGRLVGGEQCKRGLEELCARPVSRRRGAAEGKKDVLSKADLKKMGAKSPTFGETLSIGIYFATRFLGLLKLEDPKIAVPPQIIEPAAPVDFISGGMRFYSRFGKRQVDEKPVAEPPRLIQPDPSAGLPRSLEALNLLFTLTSTK